MAKCIIFRYEGEQPILYDVIGQSPNAHNYAQGSHMYDCDTDSWHMVSHPIHAYWFPIDPESVPNEFKSYVLILR